MSCCMLRVTLFCVAHLGLAPAYGAARKKKTSPLPEPKAVPLEIPSATRKPNILFIIVNDLNDWVRWLGGHPQAR